MKTLGVLAALAFALAASTVYSQACDFGMHAANATPVVVACDGNGCTAAPTTQQPAANPEPPASTVADAVDEESSPPVPTNFSLAAVAAR
jgi:hypothetical protein